MDTLQHWEHLLSQRGILGAAKSFGWKPDGIGWTYPVYDEHGAQIIVSEPVFRWKAFDSAASPKYRWIPSGMGDNKPRYYLLPDAVEAMRTTGKCIIASGEPDTLAYRSAGAKNVLNWFGEAQTPATLASDLASFGVKMVELAPDRDDTGLKWAQHIVNALGNSGIRWRVYELPQPMGSKYDINKLWIDCKFDVDCFWDTFIRCNELDIKPVELAPENLPLIRDDKGEREYPPAFYAAIEAALGVEKYRANGYSKNVKCPFHDDKHASAGWDHEKHILKCMTCHGPGEWALAKDVAAKLGIRPDDYYPAKPVTVKQAAGVKPAPAGKPKLLYSWEEGTDKLLAQLDGDVPIYEPLTLPFSGLRALGGFAKRVGPGKMIAVIADTGMGKTSLIETVDDAWRRSGFNGVTWGPEWTYSEYVQRGIQRTGGPTYEQIEDHKVYLSEQKRGVPEDKRTGVLLTKEQRDNILDKTAAMKAWPGRMVFIEKMNLPIERVIQNMQEAADQFSANGKRIAFAVLDYVQLINATAESEAARLTRVLEAFKAFIVDRQVVGIVGSQMTKVDGRLAAGGNKGSLQSMMLARSDYFNLAMVITRSTDDQGIVSQNANCRVVKNSTGKTGDIPLFLNPDKLRWYDAEVQRVELNIPAVPIHGRD